MADGWLPGFEVVPGESAGTWSADDEHAPKVVLHTTECRLAVALAAFRANRSWPHITADPAARRRLQHVDLRQPARALRNLPGGIETNREPGVWQVEIVGNAAESHTWPADWLDWLGAEVVGPLCRATGTPLVTPVTFYGADAGWTLASTDARQRLSPALWDRLTGVLGHQHVPENSHWDPGRLNVARILAAATTDPDEVLDMSPEELRGIIRAELAAHGMRLVVEVDKADAEEHAGQYGYSRANAEATQAVAGALVGLSGALRTIGGAEHANHRPIAEPLDGATLDALARLAEAGPLSVEALDQLRRMAAGGVVSRARELAAKAG